MASTAVSEDVAREVTGRYAWADDRLPERCPLHLSPGGLSQGFARNLIFLVVDGMNAGMLTMAHQYLQQTQDSSLNWMRLYRQPQLGLARGVMETASADSIVTDSSAASSSWGGGERIPNTRVNVCADGRETTPLLVKAKQAGKATGLVSTARITHATPAGFAANALDRDDEDRIARQYLEREVDVLLGGGRRHFDPAQREDGRDLWRDFRRAGYLPLHQRVDLEHVPHDTQRLLGLFDESHLPYSLDRLDFPELRRTVPPLVDLMATALPVLSRREEGFVLQVEGARVDHAAHANDPGAALWEFLSFDRCIALALDFQQRHPDTLVILTTDHGTGGLQIGGVGAGYRDTNRVFQNLTRFQRSFELMARDLPQGTPAPRVQTVIQRHTGLELTDADAERLAAELAHLERDADYGPTRTGSFLKPLMAEQCGINWISNQHTGDLVEICAWGPGSGGLPQFIRNWEVHHLVCEALRLA
ncbi:MAG: alkaline phosphatase [Puniceicoccaceae bacterium 5H]|nr:MAG: alkaline phosphatase [Puniceicoccaceae bacterium 5H]